jgi:hypothetical protein
LRDGFDGGVQRAVLAEFAAEVDDLLLRGRVRLAQFVRVGDAVQVRHRRPDAIQAIFERFAETQYAVEVARRLGREQRVDARAVIREHGVDGGFDMFGADRGKTRQGAAFEQGIGHADTSGGARKLEGVNCEIKQYAGPRPAGIVRERVAEAAQGSER